MEGRSPRELIPAQRLPATVEYRTEVEMALRKPPAMTPLLFPEEWGELLRWADVVLAAGSLVFYGQLTAAIRAARYELSSGFAQILYPATFLCGMGACQACVADVAGGRRRVCLRGPVFDLADVAV
jgi:NAD(P)H-flavin reductase